MEHTGKQKRKRKISFDWNHFLSSKIGAYRSGTTNGFPLSKETTAPVFIRITKIRRSRNQTQTMRLLFSQHMPMLSSGMRLIPFTLIASGTKATDRHETFVVWCNECVVAARRDLLPGAIGISAQRKSSRNRIALKDEPAAARQPSTPPSYGNFKQNQVP